MKKDENKAVLGVVLLLMVLVGCLLGAIPK